MGESALIFSIAWELLLYLPSVRVKWSVSDRLGLRFSNRDGPCDPPNSTVLIVDIPRFVMDLQGSSATWAMSSASGVFGAG